MMTFSGLLAWLSPVDGGAGEVVPAIGRRLSVLALELPRGITPTIAGLTVGAFVGVVGFLTVLLLAGGGSRRRRRRRPMLNADHVVFIPPYGTMQRETPLPPRAFCIPPPAPRAAGGQALPFVPSTQLSARVFAKMGYAVECEDDYDGPDVDPMLSIEVDFFDEDDMPSLPPVAAVPAVTVSRVVVLSSTPPRGTSADKSAPHPLGIIKSSSIAMRAAPIADLAFDDHETEIGETYFDEPPQPRRRTDPPKIRAKIPTGPRFPDHTPPLPRVTPPPMRAVR